MTTWTPNATNSLQHKSPAGRNHDKAYNHLKNLGLADVATDVNELGRNIREFNMIPIRNAWKNCEPQADQQREHESREE